MSSISIIGTLMVIGLLLWLVNTRVPMDIRVRKFLNLMTIAVVVLWLMGATGIWGSMRGILASG